MTENKTIKEWLESIEDPEIREKAMRNHQKLLIDKPSLKDIRKSSLVHAITNAFTWADTPEDFNYWKNFTNSLPTDRYDHFI